MARQRGKAQAARLHGRYSCPGASPPEFCGRLPRSAGNLPPAEFNHRFGGREDAGDDDKFFEIVVPFGWFDRVEVQLFFREAIHRVRGWSGETGFPRLPPRWHPRGLALHPRIFLLDDPGGRQQQGSGVSPVRQTNRPQP